MGHSIIIKKSIAPSNASSLAEHSSGIEAEVTYTPSHDLTDEQVGSQVARILRKIGQMSASDA